MLVAQSCPTLCDRQAPLSTVFSRQEYWSGLPRFPPGDLADTGMEPASHIYLHWQAGSLPLAPPGREVNPYNKEAKDWISKIKDWISKIKEWITKVKEWIPNFRYIVSNVALTLVVTMQFGANFPT